MNLTEIRDVFTQIEFVRFQCVSLSSQWHRHMPNDRQVHWPFNAVPTVIVLEMSSSNVINYGYVQRWCFDRANYPSETNNRCNMSSLSFPRFIQFWGNHVHALVVEYNTIRFRIIIIVLLCTRNTLKFLERLECKLVVDTASLYLGV